MATEQKYSPVQRVNIGPGKDDVNDFARKYNLEIENIYDLLNKYTVSKVVFYGTSSFWSSITGGYRLSLPHNGNIVFAVYKTISTTESQQVLVGVSMNATNVMLDSVTKFDGYMLYAAINEELGIEPVDPAVDANAAAIAARDYANSASTTATQLMAWMQTKETLTAPVVDPTLTISGAAADAEVTGDILHSLEFGQKWFKIVENSYVNLNGGFTYASDFSRSDYIECTDYSAIRITAPVGSEYNAFYDAQKAFISSFTVKAGSKTYNVPSNACYFAISNTHEAMQQTKVETYLSSEILDAEDEIAITNDVINCLKTTEEYIKPFIDNKYIDNTDGSERNYTGWSATGYIPTEKFDGYLRIKTNRTNEFNAFYDSTKNFTRSFSVKVGDNLIRINSNEAYVRLSNGTSSLGSTILSSPIINHVGDISCGFVGDVVSLNHGMKEKILQANRNTNFTLLHLSDIHMNVNSLINLVDVIKFHNKYSALIDDAVCTGDMVGQKFSDAYYTAVWDANGGGEILTCIGNHDCTEGGDQYGRVEHTQAEVYDKFIEPYVTGETPSWGEVSYQENITYWYKDYAGKLVRLISMNALLSGDEATAQNTWLQQTLAGAKTNGYSVIILTHYGPYNGVKVDCNFTDKIEPVLSGFKEMYQQSVQDFIDGGGDFVCYLSGHTHYDLICKNSNYPNQLFVVVTSTNGGFPDFTKPKDRFNVLTFDKTRHIVKIIRVGQDRDVYMRHIGLITIDYKTLEVIYSE